jgi:hypothetical protein
MPLAASSMKPSVPPVAALPLFHLCLVKIVQSIVVIVSKSSVPLVLPVGMIAATAAVVTMEVAVAAEVTVVAAMVAVSVTTVGKYKIRDVASKPGQRVSSHLL